MPRTNGNIKFRKENETSRPTAARHKDDEWSLYEITIKDLFAEGHTKQEILELLDLQHGFRPSLEQLRHKMRQQKLNRGPSVSLPTPENSSENSPPEPRRNADSLERATTRTAERSGASSSKTNNVEPDSPKPATPSVPVLVMYHHQESSYYTEATISSQHLLAPPSTQDLCSPSTSSLPGQQAMLLAASPSVMHNETIEVDDDQSGFDHISIDKDLSTVSRDTFATHSSDSSSLRAFRRVAGNIDKPTSTKKPIGQRATYTCHVCDSSLGRSHTCGICGHRRCKDCKRTCHSKTPQKSSPSPSWQGSEQDSKAYLANAEMQLDLIIEDIQRSMGADLFATFPQDVLSAAGLYAPGT